VVLLGWPISFVISLYFQNIKLAGVNRQGLEIFIMGGFSELRVIASFYPLDRFSGEYRFFGKIPTPARGRHPVANDVGITTC
jgi:hypothetical protein